MRIGVDLSKARLVPSRCAKARPGGALVQRHVRAEPLCAEPLCDVDYPQIKIRSKKFTEDYYA